MIKNILLTISLLMLLTGCSEEKEAKKEDSVGMKCGAGKCGANMFDANTALAKKKKNILSQMKEEDKRKECVINAKTTKAVYDCVRDPKTKKLSLKCGSKKEQKRAMKEAMKCAAGKCE